MGMRETEMGRKSAVCDSAMAGSLSAERDRKALDSAARAAGVPHDNGGVGWKTMGCAVAGCGVELRAVCLCLAVGCCSGTG